MGKKWNPKPQRMARKVPGAMQYTSIGNTIDGTESTNNLV